MEHPEEEEPDRREGDVLKYIQKFESGECWVILVSFFVFYSKVLVMTQKLFARL